MGVANIGSRIPFSRLHPLHWLLFTGISSNVWIGGDDVEKS